MVAMFSEDLFWEGIEILESLYSKCHDFFLFFVHKSNIVVIFRVMLKLSKTKYKPTWKSYRICQNVSFLKKWARYFSSAWDVEIGGWWNKIMSYL